MEPFVDDLRRALDEVKSSLKFDGWRILYGGMRYAFISCELLMRVTKELMTVLGPPIKTVILQFTALSCFAEVNHMINSGVPPERVLEKYAELVSAAGWGYTKVVNADFEKLKVTVRMYNSSIATWFRDNVEKLERTFPFYECAWWGYGWLGAVKAALEGMGVEAPSLTYEEVECLAKGGKYCEWVVTQGESPISQRMESAIPKEMFNYDSVKAVINGAPAPGNPEESIKAFLSLLEVRNDASIGIGRDRMLLAPSILFSIAYWTLPLEMFGDLIYTVFKRAHGEYGRYLSSQGEKYGAEGVLNFFLSSASSMGWGKMEVTEFSDSIVKFQIHQSLHGEEGGAYRKLRGLKPQPTCVPIGYIAEGILNYFAEKEGGHIFTSKEEKCVAKGDGRCEFVMEKT